MNTVAKHIMRYKVKKGLIYCHRLLDRRDFNLLVLHEKEEKQSGKTFTFLALNSQKSKVLRLVFKWRGKDSIKSARKIRA
jgi:hypothetical protein